MLVHVWFATKRRKWLLQGDILEATREEIASAATRNGIRLIEHEAIVDHVHLLIDLRASQQLPKVMNQIKGTSARRIFQRFPELKMDAEVQSFWQSGYGHKLVPERARNAVSHYIRSQWERLEDYER